MGLAFWLTVYAADLSTTLKRRDLASLVRQKMVQLESDSEKNYEHVRSIQSYTHVQNASIITLVNTVCFVEHLAVLNT